MNHGLDIFKKTAKGISGDIYISDLRVSKDDQAILLKTYSSFVNEKASGIYE